MLAATLSDIRGTDVNLQTVLHIKWLQVQILVIRLIDLGLCYMVLLQGFPRVLHPGGLCSA